MVSSAMHKKLINNCINLLIEKKVKSLIIVKNNQVGIGTTHTVKEIMEKSNTPFTIINGDRIHDYSVELLVETLKTNSDKVVIFDGCDEFLDRRSECINILKAAIDMEKSLVTFMRGGELTTFSFTGSICFLYTKNGDYIDQAVEARSILIDLCRPTKEEIVERITVLLKEIHAEMPIQFKLGVLKNYAESAVHMNMKELVKLIESEYQRG
jgi:hypothetical protein